MNDFEIEIKKIIDRGEKYDLFFSKVLVSRRMFSWGVVEEMIAEIRFLVIKKRS